MWRVVNIARCVLCEDSDGNPIIEAYLKRGIFDIV
jgi:hypothetical protein